MEYDSHSALLVVDIQNDFADPAGNLSVRGGRNVIPVANREIAAARTAGALVAYSQDWHPPHTPHFAADGGIWPVHCVAGSWGAEFVPGLEVAGEIIHKGVGGEDGYSAFTVRDPKTGTTVATPLAQLLRKHDIRRVTIVGLATDYCVKATALDALSLDLETIVLRKGVRAVNLKRGDGKAALAEIEAAGGHVV